MRSLGVILVIAFIAAAVLSMVLLTR